MKQILLISLMISSIFANMYEVVGQFFDKNIFEKKFGKSELLQELKTKKVYYFKKEDSTMIVDKKLKLVLVVIDGKHHQK